MFNFSLPNGPTITCIIIHFVLIVSGNVEDKDALDELAFIVQELEARSRWKMNPNIPSK
jgi:hypothetical protein